MIVKHKRFFLSIIYICFIGTMCGQQPSYILSLNGSGTTRNYVARDSISLVDNFSYHAEDFFTFNARIDEKLIFPPATNYAIPGGGNTSDPSLGGVVGTIPGQFNVSQTEGATYTIPIEGPSGINGIQPNISLVYNSQGGNGPLGVGWSISGLSSITCVPENYFSNNGITGINLSIAATQYALDGNSLFNASGTYGGDGCSYYTENKTNSQIFSYGSVMGQTSRLGPDYFKVITKEGTIIEYRYRIHLGSNPQLSGNLYANAPFQWLVSKIMDANGNYMTFSYQTQEGQAVINKIEYTGNGSLSPYASINFVYGTKATIRKTYLSGFSIEDRFLLNSIQVKTNNTVLRQYNLTYNLNKELYYLKSVSLNGQGEKINATNLEWGSDHELISIDKAAVPSTTYPNVANSSKTWISADVNSDGLTDLINIYYADYLGSANNYADICLASIENGQVVFTKVDLKVLGPNFNIDQVKITTSSIYFGEMDGDGDKELVKPYYWYLNGPRGMDFHVYDENKTYKHTYNSTSSEASAYAFGDLNNDGIEDIISIEKGKVNNTHYSGKLFFPAYCTKISNAKVVNFELNQSPKSIYISDFNMDGLKDLFITTSNRCYFYKNQGGQLNGDTTAAVSFVKVDSTSEFNSDYSVVKLGDFNGDGLMDFILNGPCNAVWKLAINNGNWGFSYYSLSNFTAIEESYTTINVDNEDCIVMDFNHDGKSDIILIDAETSYHDNIFSHPWGEYENTNVKWYTSNGTSFDVYRSYTVNNEGYTYKRFNVTGDFDGDGKEDLLNYGSDLYTGNNQTDSLYLYTSFNSEFEENLIKSVTDAFGRKTTIEYQPLTYEKTENGSDFYTKGSYTYYPIVDVQAPLYCVKTVKKPNGYGGENAVDYSYAEARGHLLGRGFLGFKKVTTCNSVLNQKAVSSTETDYNLCLPTKQSLKTTTLAGADISFSETLMTNGKTGRVLQSLPLKTTVTNSLSGLSETTDYINYDSYGNPTSLKVTKGDLVENKSIVYGQFGSWAWCPNKTVRVTNQLSLGGVTNTRSVHYNYNPTFGNLIRETSDSSNINQIATAYSDFDNYGHTLTIKGTANGSTRSSSMTYTPSGRFVLKKTNVLGEMTAYDWNETTGLLNSATNRLGTTCYTYNGFGQLSETLYPDGIREANVLRWSTTGNGYGAKYYLYSEASGSAPAYIWYDDLGREIVKETVGLNNQKIRVFTQYYPDGRVKQVSEPTFSTSAQTWAAIYAYDTYGRPATVTAPLGMTRTTYDPRKTTIITPSDSIVNYLYTNGLLEYSDQNGKKVIYTYDPSGLPKTTTPVGGQTLIMEYDLQGNRTKLIDPDAGTITSQYNGFGELLTTSQNMHNSVLITTTNNYDVSTGLLQNIVRNGETTAYGYDDLHRIETIEIAGKNKQTFTYDDFDRITRVEETIGTRVFTTQTEYSTIGREKKHIYPSGYYTLNFYDSNGNLTEVKDQYDRSLWKPLEENAKGQLKRLSRGGKVTTFGYDEEKGFPASIQSAGVVDLAYSFDTRGNLAYRQDNLTNQKELFDYDGLNRLTDWDVYQNGALAKQNAQSYDAATGNIVTRSDLDNLTMHYGLDNKPHTLDSINGVPSAIALSQLSVTYTDFRKIATLNEGNKAYTLSYGVDDQRRKSVYQVNGLTRQTRYYLGDYEEEVDAGGNIRKIHYLSGGAVFIRNNNRDSLLYGYADYQGSLTALTDENGNVLERYAYDPWGLRRNPIDWTATDTRTSWRLNRGYTGHEHLDAFSIINMNGRVYDPLTAMFFSPDPFLQSPGNWLNYNSYVYCFNNPLMYTDPSGEFVWFIPIIIGAAIFGTGNLVAHAIKGDVNSFGDGLKYFGQGALAGALLGAAWQFAPLIPGIGQAIQTGMNIYGYTQLGGAALSTVSGLGQGIFGGDWSALGNAGQIFLGNFYLDENRSFFGGAWQGFSRHTWEFIQTGLGHSIGQLRNTFGGIDDVDYFGGATLMNSDDNSGEMWGFTLGSFINSKNLDVEDEMFRHEYGHTLQGQRWGVLYPFAIGIPSAISSNFSSNEKHRNRWYEKGANRYGERYYRKYLPNNLTLTPWDDIRYPRH